jgi:serine/threonine protein kinase
MPIGTALTTSLALVQNFPQTEDENQQQRRLFRVTDKVLGKGAFGAVMEGESLLTGSPLAVKKQPNGVVAQTEAQAFSSLQGVPHAVRCRAAFLGSPKQNPNERTHHIVMDKISGNNVLETFLLAQKPIGKLSFDEIITITKQLLEFLDALNERGLTYFDLKANNFIFRRDCRHLTVIDFGGVRDVKKMDVSPVTTLQYRAPEFLLGKTLSPAYDLWSFGCTLYTLLTEKYLFYVSEKVPKEKRDNYLLQMIVQKLGKPPLEYLLNGPLSPQIFDVNMEFREKAQLPPITGWQTSIREAGRIKAWPVDEVEMFIDIIESVLCYTNRASPKELLASPLFNKEISVHLFYSSLPKCKIHLIRTSKISKTLDSIIPSDLAAADLKIDLHQSPVSCLHIPRDPNNEYIVVLEKDGALVADRISLNDQYLLNVSGMQEILAKQTVKAKRNLREDIEAVAVNSTLKKSKMEKQVPELEAAAVEVPPIDAIPSSTNAWIKKILQ